MNLKTKTFASFVLGLATLSLAQPAKAVIYDWQFTNEDGNFGANTDVVAGFVEFSASSYEELANQTNVPAIDLQITSVTGLPTGSDPFFGNGGIELGENLISLPSGTVHNNFFSFDNSGELINFNSVEISAGADENTNEVLRLQISRFLGSTAHLSTYGSDAFLIDRLGDSDGSTLSFTQQASASVPFEFSPSLGILAVGSFFAGSRLLKRRNTFVK